MTAVAGIWSFGLGPCPEDACWRMLLAQRHFGPEAPAILSEPDLAIGSRQFSLLPEDRPGGSTASSPDRRFTIAGDCRVDNRKELIAALGEAVESFARLSDVDLVARCWMRWGEETLERIIGDFAFVVWDRAAAKLHLARDIAGQRPLHFSQGPGFFAFASMPSGLLVLDHLSGEPDVEAVVSFLALLPESHDRSYYQDIGRVRPGTLLTVSPGSIDVRNYWRPSSEPLIYRRSEDYDDQARELLDRAVEARLRTCGTGCGSHLSAGLDSASVTASAAEMLAGSGSSLTAFTAVPAPGYQCSGTPRLIGDEGILAAATAGRYGNVEHVLVRSDYATVLDAFHRHYDRYERPILNPINFIWLDRIKDEAASRKIGVLLTGARGNMSLSYGGLPMLAGLFRRGRWLSLAGQLTAARGSGMRWPRLLADTFGPYFPDLFWRLLSGARHKHAHSMLLPSAWSRWNVRAKARQAGLDLAYKPALDSRAARLLALRATDYGNYNKGTLAGWGIDTRDPTSDRNLVEFCLRVPDDQFLRGGVSRALARGAMAGRLPAEVLSESRKGYQAADWHQGFSRIPQAVSQAVEQLAGEPANQAFLDIERMREMVRNWPRGDWAPNAAGHYRLALLRGIAAGDFVRRASAVSMGVPEAS